MSKAAGIAPSKLASLQEDDRSSNKDDKEGSDSGGSGGSDEREDAGALDLPTPGPDAAILIMARPGQDEWQSRRHKQVVWLVESIRQQPMEEHWCRTSGSEKQSKK